MIIVKSTGIVRRIDDLSRIVIPKELRGKMNLKKKDPMEIFVEGDNVVLTKYVKRCRFCGEMEDIFEFEGFTICEGCLKKMNDR